MIDFEACKKSDGTMDYQKYNEIRKQENEERKANGELCNMPDCNRFILWSKGYPQTCPECKSLDNPEELNHPSNVRCPKCGYHWSVFDSEDYDSLADGGHEVSCQDCGHEFEITTSISYDFKSPERMKEGEDKEQEES